LQKISIGVLIFAVAAAIWTISYAHRPETPSELSIKIEKLEAQNATLRRIIDIQNKYLERCGYVRSVKYVKN